MQNFWTTWISKRQITEFDVSCHVQEVAADPDVEVAPLFVGKLVGDVGLLLEELVDADDGGSSALKEVDDPADGDHGPGELHHVDVECGELAHGDAVGDDLVASYQEGDHQGEAEDELKRGPEHGHEADEVEAAPNVFAIGGLEG